MRAAGLLIWDPCIKKMDTVPVYLVQEHNQQDADNDDGAAGEQELLATEQRAAHEIKRVDIEHPGEEHPDCLPMFRQT